MPPKDKLSAFFDRHNDRAEELALLRDMLLQTELTETVKWGMPTYIMDDKNIVGIGCFKNYSGLWFHQGAFLQDTQDRLINAQPDKTRGLRQWRFTSAQEIRQQSDLIRDYLQEAIVNHQAGKTISATEKSSRLPQELSQALAEDSKLKAAYTALSPGRQREFAEHIGSAKQAVTRSRRLEKNIPMILRGEGLNDRYR